MSRWFGRIVAPIVLSLVLPLGIAGSASAAVTTNELVHLPSNGTVALAGRGYGHGVGMSQYGARTAASQGVDYQAILDFYYPGTTRSMLTNSSIRVQLTADTDNDVRVVAASGLKITDGRGVTSSLAFAGTTTTQWRAIRTSNNTGLQVYGLVNGSWRLWSTGGALPAPISFSNSTQTVRLVRPDGSQREYRGIIRAVESGAVPGLRTVNVVPMESYLRAVVPAESPASWPAHALRAQSVAARSYAARQRVDNAAKAWDSCDSTQCQVYNGYRTFSATGALQATHENPNTDAAISVTGGQIRSYAGKPAFTQFSSSNGGWTAAGSQPYLIAKRDNWDQLNNPNSVWNVSLSVATIRAKFPALGTPRSITVTTRSGVGIWGGRVESVTITGSTGASTVTGTQFRTAFGLRSNWWKIAGSSRLDTDFSANGRADLVTRRPDGRLSIYESNGTSGFSGSARQLGTGWQVMRLIVRSPDLTGDGNPDMLAVTKDGVLLLYRSNGSGGYAPGTRVATGWGSVRMLIAPGDFDSDGKADLLVVDAVGRMQRYSGRGDGTFIARGPISSNWQGMTAVNGAGDFTGDGAADLLARNDKGQLLLYTGNGAGQLRTPRVVGQGWKNAPQITVSGDWTGDGRPDLLATIADGSLLLYAWNGSAFGPGRRVATGWQVFNRVM